MSVPEFVAAFEVVAGPRALWIVTGKTARGEIPVGTFVGNVDRNRVWVRPDWFPWASVRNKLEGSLQFLAGPAKGKVALYAAPQAEKEFMNHLCRYGTAQRVGTVIGWFDGEPAAVFQNRYERYQPDLS